MIIIFLHHIYRFLAVYYQFGKYIRHQVQCFVYHKPVIFIIVGYKYAQSVKYAAVCVLFCRQPLVQPVGRANRVLDDKGKSSAAAQYTLYSQFTTLQLHQLFGYRKPQSGTAEFPGI